ncbi:hypothetical protein HGG78_16950 [Vibrio aestuarianus]|uniref:hypothetical protein n=1 Tax=Vibrio aestuarianus TaxID=28171 RepID=UPI0006A61A56|nr:hypothetical protein [Vibrio aestuarianus]KOE88505.1 hypothetical protein ACS86_01820 [Vibrio alginolyticus]NGZ15417.1 hypothetical protein [Vibrio aestuarianus]NKZ51565.1 hypothetical protein [Vibrio aestuarianus]
MRSVSFSTTPLRTERVSDLTATKNVREENQPKRVRDVKQTEKRSKKHPRLFRVRRKPMTFQQQKQFVKQLNSYQLKAMRDWFGFADKLDINSLNDAQLWILQAANHCQHLYPAFLRRKIKDSLSLLDDLDAPMEDANSQIVQQLVAYEHYLEGLLSILVLCRRYDGLSRKESRK